jgi:tetratricopeptide (TPR) repeat protein
MSFPPPSPTPGQPGFPQAPGAKAPLGRRRIRGLVWLLLLAILGGTAITQAPLEVGRWHLAKAIKLREDGQKAAAYLELSAAIDAFPKNPELLLQRAEWEIDDGEKEKAITDIDKCLEVAGTDVNWLQVHSLFLQNCREFQRAVDDWKKIERFSKRSGKPPRASALNGLAYAQALANVELDEALNNVDEALDLVPKEPALLDTRGFVLYRQGNYEDSLRDMDRAVKGMDADVDGVRQQYGDDAIKKPQGKVSLETVPRTLQELDSANRAWSKYERAMRSAAVGHYHRALVLAALDRKEEAEKDLAVARELIGKEPDESLF